MGFEVIIFFSGLFVTALVALFVTFTIYEVRRSNPDAFGPQSQIKPPDL